VTVDDADVPAAREVVAEALAGVEASGAEPHGHPEAEPARERWLDARQTERLLRAFGITTARTRIVRTPEEAAAVQAEMGAAVAVKSAAPVHKTELGGVRLGLARPEQVADAVRQIDGGLRAAGRGDLAEAGFLVQEMVGDGVEMVVGVTHDPTFGPILLVGMGGTLVELLKDVSVRIHPLTDVDVDEMLTGLRGHPLLTGYRGSPPVDVEALKALLFRVSALVEDVPEIAELDLNPVFVRRRGIAAVDARVKLSGSHQRRRPRPQSRGVPRTTARGTGRPSGHGGPGTRGKPVIAPAVVAVDVPTLTCSRRRRGGADGMVVGTGGRPRPLDRTQWRGQAPAK